MAKKKKNDAAIGPSFEESLGKLEAIVRCLEEGNVGLEESLNLYEEGATLLKQGHQLLAKAERRIEQVSGMDADGNPVSEPFSGSDKDAEKDAKEDAKQGASARKPSAKDSSKKTQRGKKPSSESELF
ncbi:MAG: exodeoxyribonuclease VII small subunit [Pirellulales bacterium]|nr:exodeoxyribonuclease VII small subunit [Pirellulales bacterium]